MHSSGDNSNRPQDDTPTSSPRFNARMGPRSGTGGGSFLYGTFGPYQHVAGRSQFLDTEIR